MRTISCKTITISSQNTELIYIIILVTDRRTTAVQWFQCVSRFDYFVLPFPAIARNYVEITGDGHREINRQSAFLRFAARKDLWRGNVRRPAQYVFGVILYERLFYDRFNTIDTSFVRLQRTHNIVQNTRHTSSQWQCHGDSSAESSFGVTLSAGRD